MKTRTLVRAGLGALSVSLAAFSMGACSSGSDGPIGTGGSGGTFDGTGGMTTSSSTGKGSTGGSQPGSGGTGGGTGGATSSSTTTSTSSSSASSTASASASSGTGGSGGGNTCAPATGTTDYPVETEQNDNQSTANPIPATAKGMSGALCPLGDTDFYSVVVTAGATLTAKVTTNGTGCPAPDKIQLLVLDSNFVTVAHDINDSGACPVLAPADFPELATLTAGTYYLQVRNLSANEIGQYQLDAKVQPPVCGDGLGAIGIGEQCDDGNIVAGDGCSPTCQLEHGHWLLETEPNDAISGANNVDGYDGAIGSISPIGDIDSFSFTVTSAGSSAIIRVSDGLGNCPDGDWEPKLALFGPNGLVITTTTDGDTNGCPLLAPSTDMGTTGLAVGTYTVQVTDEFGDYTQGLYVVEIRVQDPGCGDGVVQAGEQCDDGNLVAGDGCSATCQYEANYISETETNDTQALANPIGTAAGFYGAIQPAGDIDYFTVPVTVAGSSIFVEVGDGLGHCPDSFDATVKLFNPAHVAIVTDSTSSSTSCAAILPQHYPAAAGLAVGTYTVSVAATSSSDTQARYVVKIHVSPPGCGDGLVQSGEQCDDGNTTANDGCNATCQSEAPFEIEPNNSAALATPQWSGFNLWQGNVSSLGDRDYFKFTLAAAATVTLQTTAPGDATACNFDTEIYLYDSASMQLAFNDDGGLHLCSKVTKALAAGTYYARVNAHLDNSTGTYVLNLSSQ